MTSPRRPPTSMRSRCGSGTCSAPINETSSGSSASRSRSGAPGSRSARRWRPYGTQQRPVEHAGAVDRVGGRGRGDRARRHVDRRGRRPPHARRAARGGRSRRAGRSGSCPTHPSSSGLPSRCSVPAVRSPTRPSRRCSRSGSSLSPRRRTGRSKSGSPASRIAASIATDSCYSVPSPRRRSSSARRCASSRVMRRRASSGYTIVAASCIVALLVLVVARARFVQRATTRS